MVSSSLILCSIASRKNADQFTSFRWRILFRSRSGTLIVTIAMGGLYMHCIYAAINLDPPVFSSSLRTA
jgi:hypothetical protein